MINDVDSIILICVAAVVTLLIRAIPFLIFGGKKAMPETVKKVADLLPAAIMAVLVVYCLKDSLYSVLNITKDNIIILISSIVALSGVVGIHLWKRKTLLSIAAGTIIYMVLIRILPLLV